MSLSYKKLEEFADKMRVERNSYLAEKLSLEEKVVELEPDIEDLPKIDEEESSEENVEHRIARGGIAGR